MPASYEERKTTFARAGASLVQEFAQIELRAQRELSVGPGGSAYGVTFTTDDGERDISVIVSSLLPHGVEAPDLDVDSFARLIESRYEKKRQRGPGLPPTAVH